ncbi:HAD family phosphatase [Spongiactinospora sp. TRM90649]|uniref:HAD family hydrolase n=1 Tax=Spongiactinospora sp. TRM90649 TaxID=3031114 RepID=UPI0023F9174B|nr:HAD family phosphatase [Spongiactinospora sp. TRM90649]MDF5753792.1 HAD family phosphatase [Spongiactinospora sp. TRM90649]
MSDRAETPVRAVFFDMDGLLVDTERVWFEVEAEVMKRLGGSWSPEDQERLVGGSLSATVAYMIEATGSEGDPAEVARWMLDGMTTRLRSGGVEPMPGAMALLAEVRGAGLTTALVTSSARVVADVCLEFVGRGFFDHVVTGDDVTRAKPDPEPYRLAVRLAGVPESRCVVLEDSPNGVASGAAAGCGVVAVPSVLPIPPGPGRMIVGSLEQVDLALLGRLVGDP